MSLICDRVNIKSGPKYSSKVVYFKVVGWAGVGWIASTAHPLINLESTWKYSTWTPQFWKHEFDKRTSEKHSKRNHEFDIGLRPYKKMIWHKIHCIRLFFIVNNYWPSKPYADGLGRGTGTFLAPQFIMDLPSSLKCLCAPYAFHVCLSACASCSLVMFPCTVVLLPWLHCWSLRQRWWLCIETFGHAAAALIGGCLPHLLFKCILAWSASFALQSFNFLVDSFGFVPPPRSLVFRVLCKVSCCKCLFGAW